MAKKVENSVEKIPEKIQKVPDKNTGTKSTEKDDSKISEQKIPEQKKKENQPPIENENFEIRKSPRIKKRPAEDTGKRSSRKSQPKKRKECSTPISGLNPGIDGPEPDQDQEKFENSGLNGPKIPAFLNGFQFQVELYSSYGP